VEEDLHQPPVKKITWYHTGAYFNQQKVLDQFEEEYNKGSFEFDLPKPILPNGLTAEESREALRACKGIVLRQEIYSTDGSADADKPYAINTHNCIIKLLQPQLENKYAVFLSHESEALNIHYERNLNDPRIAHTLNIEVDDFGNVLQAASVVYGRKIVDAQLPAAIQTEQSKTHVVYTVNSYTNDFDLPDTYRLEEIAETKTFELTNNSFNAITQFTIDSLLNDFTTASTIQYQDKPNGSLQKRLIEDVQTIYLNNDLKTPLSLLQMDTLGFAYQTFKLAFTPSLITNIYGGRLVNQNLIDAKYIQQGGVNWWIPSGKNIYLQNAETIADAQQRFFLPVAVQDAFEIETKLSYDAYHLVIIQTEDAAQNISTVEAFDYRTLQPTVLKDMNDNISENITDELGMVIATSVHGDESDGNHGDEPLTNYTIIQPADVADVVANPNKFLQKATTFFYYDLFAWMNSNQPVCFVNVVRETHESELNNNQTKTYISVGYSNGLGQNLQTKVQAEPGDALKWQGNNLVTIDTTPNLRWVGNGRTIVNNKVNVVKQFEPFFSTTFQFENDDSLVEIGFSSVFYYDALSRTIRIEHANGTFSKTEFDAWKQLKYDENDTVLDSQWYVDRGSPNPLGAEPADAEQRAAWLAAKHANTPSQEHFDSLGRTIFTIADNGASGKYATQIVLDIENNQRQIIDARNNTVMQFDYDMLSRQVHQISMDGGERFVFNDVLDKVVFNWDDLNHRFKTEYDVLHRPLKQWLKEDVNTAAPEKSIHFSVYGENQANDKQLNLRGKLFESFDQSGLVKTSEYDFKYNIKKSSRQLCKEYKKIIDYNVVNPTSLLNTETFNSNSIFDALNRAVEIELPDASKIHPTYNEAALLEQVNIFVQSQNQNIAFVQNINYNAKAQRESILYGNNTSTKYTYDEKTYNLIRILTTRNNGANIMQDLNYTFEPVSNITSVIDNAQQTIFFNNAAVDPSMKYEYDAIYRLIYSQGREHAGANAASDQFDSDKTTFNNQRLTLPGDMNAMQRYEEKYDYDEVGNMLHMIHNAGNGIFSNKWTRTFSPNANNNRLTQTQVGANVTTYNYDAHGNLQNLQNGTFGLTWNYLDQLQQVDLGGGGGTAYYVYDSNGNRVRKIIENGTLIKERIYLNSYELYREAQNGNINLERETIHVMDDKQRIALIETRTKGEDNGLAFLIRYQYSNHIETACLELDNNASIISYEEYYPFGSTAYQAMRNQTETSKRYRYTGKERDAESGLYYHGKRYYACWLVRWTAVDPIEIKDGINDYVYCSNNPVLKKDLTGTDGTTGGTWKTTTDANGQPVYQSTGDQATKDLGNVGKATGGIFLDSEQFKAIKKQLLDPKLDELTASLKIDWEKNKASLIVGGVLIVLPTAAVITALGIKNEKLNVPVVGDVYTGQAAAGLLGLLLGAGSEKLTDERFKISVSYEKKDDKTDLYGFEITLKPKKSEDEKKDEKKQDTKSPEKTDPNSPTPTQQKSAQQKQLEQLRKDIAAPPSLTIGGKFGTGTVQGSIKYETPTALGRFSVSPALKIAPQTAPNVTVDLGLTTIVGGNRVKIGAQFFVNNPASTSSPFDAKYDDKTQTGTVTTTPPLRGTGGTLGISGTF
ncbi:MAG TPA: toxin TcdB middle/C-terminal domain-containing protein, partial [Parafilimonas sp.]|nr:toxin TcdB middle/C-terminal domain-containing protein [Parafilimonas sp.]